MVFKRLPVVLLLLSNVDSVCSPFFVPPCAACISCIKTLLEFGAQELVRLLLSAKDASDGS